MTQLKRSVRRELSQIEHLQEDIMAHIKDSSYAHSELFNLFCVKREGSARRCYDSETLDFAISGLLEEQKLGDFGGGFYGRPRPSSPRDETSDSSFLN